MDATANGARGSPRVGKRRCTLECLAQTRAAGRPAPTSTIVFAPLKHTRLDYMVQKATEMGVAHLQPVLTRRTVAARVNLERMRANAIEAAEQCGVLRVPTVGEPLKLEAALAAWDPKRKLIFCDEAADMASPLAALSTIEDVPLAVLIGPEGGFDPAERALLREQTVCAADLARTAHHARRHGGRGRAGAGQRRAWRLALDLKSDEAALAGSLAATRIDDRSATYLLHLSSSLSMAAS